MDDFFVRNRLSAYLDGELSTAEAREVEAALARSPALRAEYEQLRQIVAELRQAGPLEAPPRLRSNLARALAREAVPSRWRRLLPRIPVEALALAAVALVALVFVSRSPKDSPVATAVPVPAVTPTTPVPTDAAPAAPPDAVARANGVLGDEARPLSTTGRQSMAEPNEKKAATRTSSSSKAAMDKEAYAPDWEKNTGTAPPPDLGAANTAGTAKPVASVPPYRYRLRTASDAALKTLSAVAAELGGKLVDQNGRSLATYPMEAGDARSVQIVVPSYNVEALHDRLREMGDVETMAADASTLYAPGADVPVAIEVQRE